MRYGARKLTFVQGISHVGVQYINVSIPNPIPETLYRSTLDVCGETSVVSTLYDVSVT